MSAPKASSGWRRAAVIGVPYAWLVAFFLLPFLIVLKISVSTASDSVPPYEPLLSWDGGGMVPSVAIHLDNFGYLFSDPLYLLAYLSSIRNAAVTTLICLLIGYPMAYAIARSAQRTRPLLLLLVIMPFWTSFLLRIYAWIGILKPNGLLNGILLSLGVIHQPLEILNTQIAVFIGMVYGYLPFVVLPLYATLEKMDLSLLEAASDLGAKPMRAFWSITWPLSLPGVYAGSLLVFIPAIGEFIIPSLLGGANTLMIASVLWNEYFLNRDWPVAAAVTVVMVLLLVVPLALFQRSAGGRGLGARGAA